MENTDLYIGEPDVWRSDDVRERAKQLSYFCVAQSLRHYGPLRKNWDEYFDRYTNQPINLRQTNRVRSSLPSGMASEMIDTFRADLIDAIFAHRPIVNVNQQEPDDFDAARVNEGLIQFQYDQMGYWNIIDQALFSALVWGTGFGKLSWVRKVVNKPLSGVNGPNGKPEMVPTMGYQGPVIIPAFVYDVFPHPGKMFMDDFYPITHLTFESFSDIEALSDIIYEDKWVQNIPERFNLNDTELNGLFINEDIYERADQRSRMGWSSDARMASDGVMVFETECMFRPKIDWTDGDGKKRKGSDPVRTIITVANGEVIRVSPSPSGDESSVWLGGKVSAFPGQFYGQSFIQKNKPQIHMVEVALNMGLQNLAQSVNRMKIIRPDLVYNPQSWDDSPGGNIFAKPNAVNLDGVVRTLDPTPVSPDVFRFIQYGTQRAEGTLGATDLKSGRVSQGETTATESNLAFKQASIRFKYHLGMFGQTFITPSAQKMQLYNRDYLEIPYVFKIMGRDGQNFKAVQQDDLAINADFVFLGPDRLENEQMKIAQLENLYKITTALSQFGWSQPILQEIFVQLADAMNFPNMEQLKELMGYGQKPENLGLLAPPQSPEGVGGPNRRQDRRLGSGGIPQSAQDIAKSLGGLLGARTGQ